jgi:alkylation response protein AidB-like acyl-CoA dehydrogenase
VHVEDARIVPLGDPAVSVPLLNSLMIWFLPLITAAYLGIATGQVERLFTGKRGAAVDRVRAFASLETVAAAVEALARDVDSAPHDEALLGRTLLVRYTAQRAIAEATDQVLELLGGMAFVTGTDGIDLLAASRALAFHPPAEAAMRERMDAWLDGDELSLI